MWWGGVKMPIDPKYQYDLGIVFEDSSVVFDSGSRASLSLSSTGDIQVVSGKDKLITQLARAVMNENVTLPVNTPNVSGRQLKTLFTIILKNFKRRQIEETDRINPNFIGYTIYRKGGPVDYSGDTEDTFIKISKDAITYRYLDIKLANGSIYEYRFAKTYKTGIESSSVEQINVTPSQFLSEQRLIIGNNVVGFAGNQSVTLYVDTNRIYKQSELLQGINDISAYVSETEPRKWVIDIEVQNVLGERISFSPGRQNKIR